MYSVLGTGYSTPLPRHPLPTTKENAMTYDDELLDLLDRWDEIRAEKGDASIAELCADCPDLRQALEKAIDKQKAIKALVAPAAGQQATESFSSTPSKTSGAQPLDERRFQVLRQHRVGGLGEVLVAYDGELEREVALKRIQSKHTTDPDACRRFLREAKLTGRLEHPGIVPVYALVPSGDGPPCYAMRLIEGETLKEAIDRFYGGDETTKHTKHTKAGIRAGRPLIRSSVFFRVFGVFRGSFDRLAFRQLLNRFLTVCQTIAYAHSPGIVHRDLKPANIILGKYGETIVVDWGLAKAADHPETTGPVETSPELVHGEDSVPTKEGQIVGTPQYMSPEQAAGRLDQVGPASDIYGLGATLYCLLTGSPPFADPRETSVEAVLQQVQQGSFRRPRQVQRALPRALEAICLKALALRPQDRYPSAQALADDLEHWLGDEPVTAYREPRRTRLARWLRRHRALSASLAVLAATGL